MVFELLEEVINLEYLKDLMLNRINNLELNEYKLKWIENVKNAANFNELIRGMQLGSFRDIRGWKFNF